MFVVYYYVVLEALVAQLVEQAICNRQVVRSNRTGGTTNTTLETNAMLTFLVIMVVLVSLVYLGD